MRELRQQVGMIFQSSNHFPHLSAGRNVMRCDEITSALHPELVGEVLQVVEMRIDECMTQILVMHQGRIHEAGTPDQIFNRPQTP